MDRRLGWTAAYDRRGDAGSGRASPEDGARLLDSTPGEPGGAAWRATVLRLAGVGLLVGFPLALGLSRILNSALTTTIPLDMAVLTVVPAFLIVAALAATYIPARRAMRIDPAVVLRGE